MPARRDASRSNPNPLSQMRGPTQQWTVRTERLTDAELIARAVEDSDGAAFAELYRRHIDAVLAYLRRRVAMPELALDLAAETFAAAVESAHRFRGDGEVAAWLYGIARNKLLESLRRGRVEDAARRALGQDPLICTEADLELVELRAADVRTHCSASSGCSPMKSARRSWPAWCRSAATGRSPRSLRAASRWCASA